VVSHVNRRVVVTRAEKEYEQSAAGKESGRQAQDLLL
jgi:hypothetical protein